MNFTLKTQIGTIAIVLISSFFTSAVTAAPAAPAIRAPGKPAAQPAPHLPRQPLQPLNPHLSLRPLLRLPKGNLPFQRRLKRYSRLSQQHHLKQRSRLQCRHKHRGRKPRQTIRFSPKPSQPPAILPKRKALRWQINQRSPINPQLQVRQPPQIHRPSRRLRLIPATKPLPPPPQQRNRKQQKRQRPNRLQQKNKAPPLCPATPSASRTKRKTTIPCCPKQQPGNWTLPWRT